MTGKKTLQGMSDEEKAQTRARFDEAMKGAFEKVADAKAKGQSKAANEANAEAIEKMMTFFRNEGLTRAPLALPTEPERAPTVLERNGRKVVIDALDEATLRDAPVEVLVERYADLAAAAHHAIEHGRVTRHNRLVGRQRAIAKALAARVPDARTALLPLLDDSDPAVRAAAAYDCREIAPDRARRRPARTRPRSSPT